MSGVVALAALAMVIQDVFGVLLTQAQARNHGWLAGTFDSLQWGAAIVTTTVSVTALQGHDLPFKVAVIAAVTVANFAGALLGVALGKRFIKEET